MKFISIDLETTGLNPKADQILQLGALFVDTEKSLFVPFKRLIKHDRITGHPFALNMNRDLIQDIANGAGQYLDQAMIEFEHWIFTHYGEAKFNAAGKNFAGFDNLFLKWKDCRPASRVLDPGSMYVIASDDAPPSLQTCCKRAGIIFDPDAAHDALYDAERVAYCVVNFLKPTTVLPLGAKPR